MQHPQQSAVAVPLGYPSSLIYMDESGISTNSVFVMGALKVRGHGELARGLKSIRAKTGFGSEFRFTRVSSENFQAYLDALTLVGASDTRFAGTIVDRQVFNPHPPGRVQWECQAEIAIRLLKGCINKRELVSVVMDYIGTPPTVFFEDYVMRKVNQGLRNKSVVTAAMHDSKSTDLLQMVDVLTGAVAWDYKRSVGRGAGTSEFKERVAAHAKVVFGVTEFTGRHDRANVVLLRGEGNRGSRTGRILSMNKRRAG